MSPGAAGLIAAMCVGGLLMLIMQELWRTFWEHWDARDEQRSRRAILRELRRAQARRHIKSHYPEDQ